MIRRCCMAVFFIFLSTLPLAAQEGIRKAKVKKIDLEKMVLTLTVGDKDQEFRLTEKMQVLGAQGKNLKERLQGFKEGSAIFFKTEKRDMQDVLVGVKLDDGGPGSRPVQPKVDTTHLKPLPVLGTDEYQGFEGGLYPGGKNERPQEHEAAGLRLAKEIMPRGTDGQPAAEGKVVLLSIGMSNTSQASEGFARHLAGFADKNPALVFVNGAQGGMTAAAIVDAGNSGRGAKYWSTVDERLKQAGVTRAQVQAVWLKQADAGPREGFPAYAKQLQSELAAIARELSQRFPNLKQMYLSSRTYGGFATTPLNPEPYAYESGFSVKWLIEQQLKGEAAVNYDPAHGKVLAPWMSWGPYLWANGAKKNADGLFYESSDFAPDGTHHSRTGMDKQGRQLLEFFRSDATTKPWFLRH